MIFERYCSFLLKRAGTYGHFDLHGCMCMSHELCFCQRLRFTRKTWRKARSAPAEGWPMWVKLQKPVLELFETMQPFQDEDDYDVAKAWGISVPQQFNLNCFTSVDDV